MLDVLSEYRGCIGALELEGGAEESDMYRKMDYPVGTGKL